MHTYLTYKTYKHALKTSEKMDKWYCKSK